MSFSLRPHQLVAHWVPGFTLLLAIQLWRPSAYCHILQRVPSAEAPRAFLWAFAAFVLGQLLDAIRNVWEGLWEWAHKKSKKKNCLRATTALERLWGKEVSWDFFVEAERSKVDQLEDFYFTYYAFSSNLIIPLLAFFLVSLGSAHYCLSAVPLAAAVILFFDARSLREEIAKYTRRCIKEKDMEKNNKEES